MSSRLPGLSLCAVIIGIAACESVTAPTPLHEPVSQASFHGGAVCSTIDFNQFAHGAIVSSVPSGFGFDLAVQVAAGSDRSGPRVARAYDTNNVDGPDPDLEWQGTAPECPACQGLGRVLVIGSSNNTTFNGEGDYVGGGSITFTGFAGQGTFFVNSFKALDQEPPPAEESMRLLVDGVDVAGSSGLGNGSVETVQLAAKQTFFNTMAFVLGGSGAIDDIQICREVPDEPGEQGCTPGFWRNHLSQWAATGYSPNDDFDTVFGVNFFSPDITLHQAVILGGGGVNRVARHGVAALLSAAHPDVAYPYTVAQVIALVQALNGDALEQANELGCPLN
jgi:hypothetical protein